MTTVRLTGGNDTYTTKTGDAVVHALGGKDKITIKGVFYDRENERTEITVYGGPGDDQILSQVVISGQAAYGGPGNDRIEINGGDTEPGIAFGAGGNDTLVCKGGDENCHLNGQDGNDRLSSLAETGVSMTGGKGDDILLVGNGDSNFLHAGPGLDRQTAGAGRDRFQFEKGDTVAGAKRDVIAGFTQGQDEIDLSAIDANAQQSGDQPFTFVASTKHPAIGQVSYYKSGTSTVAVANDGAATFEIELQNFDQPMLATDFNP